MKQVSLETLSALDCARRLTLTELLNRGARQYPNIPALVFGAEVRSYLDLQTHTRQLAFALRERGVGHGDRVAILMRNRIEFVEATFAVLALGGVVVPINFRLTAREVGYLLRDADPIGIISDTESRGAVSPGANLRFHITTGTPQADTESFADLVKPSSTAITGTYVHEGDAAFIMYTSGTTGHPKGAVLSHQNLWIQALSWIHEVSARPGDVWMSGTPLFHIGAIGALLPILMLGGTFVVTPSTGFDAVESIQTIISKKVTLCGFAPTQWQSICTDRSIHLLRDEGHLRTIFWGASQAPLQTLELMQRTFPGTEIVNSFGQTEMALMTCILRGPDSFRKMGSVGKPTLTTEMRIVGADNRDVADGQVGELIFRGPAVMWGYHNNPEATAEAFTGGWFHSGDLGYTDDEGFIYVVDRKKDMIISGGENVYPAEIEMVLASHPGVLDAAVVGVPHPKWVETPVAIVVTDPDAPPSIAEITQFCRERLAGYKIPSRFVERNELPRNAGGKVLKRVLREEVISGRPLPTGSNTTD